MLPPPPAPKLYTTESPSPQHLAFHTEVRAHGPSYPHVTPSPGEVVRGWVGNVVEEHNCLYADKKVFDLM